MKRKKTEEPSPAKFWPVPGVDGEPYPPHVQEALDLVEKETLRRKRAECTHEHKIFITGKSDRYSRVTYQRACRECHLVVKCEHPEKAQHLVEVRYEHSGSFLEFRECRCGDMLFSRKHVKAPPQQTRRTPAYGFTYERKEQPRRERQIQRVSSSAWDYEVQRVQKLLEQSQRYNHGALSRSSETYLLRKANGEAALMMPEHWYEDDH
jgi:hypothetical protein